ncbi:MAG: tetratricopeptide repeat protein [Desulfobacterales bacterium]
MAQANDVHEYTAKQRAAIAANPDCGVSHYNLGVALAGQKKYDEAEKEFRKAIECSHGLAEAYVQIGGIQLQRGDLDGCLEYNKMAVKARPGFSEGYGNIGFVELQRGNVDEAIEALEKATFFNFRFAQALTTLANAYLMKGRVEDSIETNLKVLELQPDFAPAHNNLAIAYLEKGDHATAVIHCDKAVELGFAVAPEILAEIERHR